MATVLIRSLGLAGIVMAVGVPGCASPNRPTHSAGLRSTAGGHTIAARNPEATSCLCCDTALRGQMAHRSDPLVGQVVLRNAEERSAALEAIDLRVLMADTALTYRYEILTGQHADLKTDSLERGLPVRDDGEWTKDPVVQRHLRRKDRLLDLKDFILLHQGGQCSHLYLTDTEALCGCGARHLRPKYHTEQNVGHVLDVQMITELTCSRTDGLDATDPIIRHWMDRKSQLLQQRKHVARANHKNGVELEHLDLQIGLVAGAIEERRRVLAVLEDNINRGPMAGKPPVQPVQQAASLAAK